MYFEKEHGFEGHKLLVGTLFKCLLSHAYKINVRRVGARTELTYGIGPGRKKRNILRRFFFLFEFTSSRTYDPGFRFFVKQSSKQKEKKKNVRNRRKKNVRSSFFPAKMGLNSGEPSTRTAHVLLCLHTQ